MHRDRFSWETILYIFIGLSFFVIFLIYYSSAFPSASIKLKVTRTKAEEIGRNFLKAQGYDVSHYRSIVIFTADNTTAVFLQRVLGMRKTNEMIIKEKIPVWEWKCRWFRPEKKEEFQVGIDTSGKVVTFAHKIKETQSGANISQEQARSLAARFLTQVIGINLSGYENVEASKKKLEKRTDYYFEWKKKGFEIPWKSKNSGSGTLRISVKVQGGSIGYFSRYFKTPEVFIRQYKSIRSQGELLSIISLIFAVLIGIAALVVFILKYKEGAIAWKFSLMISLTVVLLLVINYINSFPVIAAGYPTAISFKVYIAMIIATALLGSVIYGLFILFTGASGSALTKEISPSSIKVLAEFMQGKILTRTFFFSCLRGYALGFFSLGYMTLFYMIGRKYLGVFLPARGPYSNILCTYLPWLAPLSIALLAAISEEFTFRLFSVSFLRHYLKLTFLAVILPAIIWAFGHSNYPVFPVYVRGIELTILGIIYGLFFLRFNIMTCIIAHYVTDAVLIAIPLLSSGNSYYISSGIIVCLLVIIPLFLGMPGLHRSRRY